MNLFHFKNFRNFGNLEADFSIILNKSLWTELSVSRSCAILVSRTLQLGKVIVVPWLFLTVVSPSTCYVHGFYKNIRLCFNESWGMIRWKNVFWIDFEFSADSFQFWNIYVIFDFCCTLTSSKLQILRYQRYTYRSWRYIGSTQSIYSWAL